MGCSMACDVGNIYLRDVLQQAVMNFQRIHQGLPSCLTLLAMTTCGALLLVGGLQRAV